jgi:hypothetical protein
VTVIFVWGVIDITYRSLHDTVLTQHVISSMDGIDLWDKVVWYFKKDQRVIYKHEFLRIKTAAIQFLYVCFVPNIILIYILNCINFVTNFLIEILNHLFNKQRFFHTICAYKAIILLWRWLNRAEIYNVLYYFQ